MFQDIAPHVLRNEYLPCAPKETDLVYIARRDMVLLEEKDGALTLPLYADIERAYPETAKELTYLFSVDATNLYIGLHDVAETTALRYMHMNVFREVKPAWLAFASATAAHLSGWYDTRRFCGRCATPMQHKHDERAMVCPNCGNIEYPKIAPVVIVAVTDGDRILLTKYAAGYNRYALIAGFIEIGETLEEGLQREVMEEVGLRVKNIRYYKSQPWAFSGSLLTGFFVELDGSDQVKLDKKELSEGVWFTRDTIPPGDSTLSLTWTMVEAFRNKEF